MRVVLPYVTIAPGVREAMDRRRTGYPYETHNVAGDDQAYGLLLARLWSAGETVVVVEHDVIVRPDSIAELDACPEPWCSWPVPYLTGEYAGMACVKFDAELMRDHPGLIEEARTHASPQHPAGHWCTMDHWIRTALQREGADQHVHRPALTHVRATSAEGGPVVPSHGCWHP